LIACTSVFAASLSSRDLKPAEEIIRREIRSGHIPGAVLIVGSAEKIILKKAYGYRSIKPVKESMTVDTIFDLASLTKVVATTTAVMQLVDRGKLGIDDKVSEYWPEFKANGKEDITVRHLLTHSSGLRPDLPLGPDWSGYDVAMDMIVGQRPVSSPGSRYLYSDINFEVLGELVRRISGKPLDEYCSEHVFGPLDMDRTFFKPDKSYLSCIAPTQFTNGKKGRLLCGEVHDPSAQRMGGVAGHAGLFSTADDLSVFARMLLNNGSFNGVKILEPRTVDAMTIPESSVVSKPFRGFGWSIDAPFAANREALLPVGSYGHKGYTGTLIWIDPVTDIYIVLLTNRVHPYGKGDAEPLRKRIINLVSQAAGTVSANQVLRHRPSLTAFCRSGEDVAVPSHAVQTVQTGIDVLEKNGFSEFSGLRLGLITNHSGLDSSGRRTIDLLRKAPDITLKAIFTPEHGLTGRADKKIASTKEPLSGLPVYSLYGDTLRPTEKMLAGIDALVFDVQDAGVRFYTYISTMAYAMRAASRKGIPFYVLDRPNPLNAVAVQGPVLEKDMLSFTGCFPLPVRHGMTVGELAEMFNSEGRIGAQLHVMKMKDYKRDQWFDQTGLRWVNPSPNLRSLNEAILYPGTALAEGSNVSVGRGTPTPFELIGAPWINAEELASYLNSRKIKGVSFKPTLFIPDSDIYKKQKCNGVRIALTDRDALDPALLGIEIISALNRLHPRDFQINETLGLVGSREVLQKIKDGEKPLKIATHWKDDLDEFKD
ncbi:MAG TPA: exo-beta-N-acetylmuramidase NamZ domain-containing protein, partial [Thermodesulfovibrionales bacterium]|nr:exo-beta-N-acetylmuramidase NamZ domain-containing protein [Thermodesulfovibrionales bacterium]